MEVENILVNNISLTEQSTKLDASCKRLLANKIILAWIMKHCMEEYSEYDVAEIAEKYIEGSPQIASMTVHQDEVNAELITGMATESNSVQEGKVTYDIRFWAVHPKSGELIRLIINIEAQNDFYPGYPLIKRGSAEDKKHILEEEFHIKMTRKLEKEMMEMCNYSKGVLERGIEQGIERGIEQGIENFFRNLMDSMNWTEDQAMEALKIPEQQRNQYRKGDKASL